MNHSKKTTDLEIEISTLYRDFFDELDIEYDKSNTEEFSGTGIWSKAPNDKNLRFATMPHIGENYADAKIKVLFVGLDIGNDEAYKNNAFLKFADRRSSFGEIHKLTKQHHVAGTYLESLFLFREEYPDLWNAALQYSGNNLATINHLLKTGLLPTDLFSYIAQTNLYKFVTIGRNGREGNIDRKYFQKVSVINKLLLDEIKILKPNIIWFQGSINEKVFSKLKVVASEIDSDIIIYRAYHPSQGRKCKNSDFIPNTPQYINGLKPDIFKK
jgi:hypothetical protein